MTAAIGGAATRGVAIRVVFNQDHPPRRPVPPPADGDWDLLRSWQVPSRPVSGVPDLMHHKYVVRDAAAVWTGSTNWTMDSWTREENVLVELESVAVAAAYRHDFEELWVKADVSRSGRFATDWAEVGDARVRPIFAPGRGQKMTHEVAQRMASARQRVRIASPVITSGPVLGTLAEMVKAGRVDLGGVYDRTQMAQVQGQWAENPLSAWKQEAFRAIAASGRFASKVSTPYAPGSVHDYMHAKLTVADDTVFVGSYNLSHSGEMNAENVLEIESPALADACAIFIERVAARYRA